MGADDPAVSVRQAREADHDAVVAIADDIWPDREVNDYVPRVFPEWVATDGPDQRTVVAEVDGGVAGLCQGVLLSDHEAWAQGIRVDPTHRGAGVGRRLTEAVFDWAAGEGATVCRNLVFSWNAAGLGTSRGLGFEPATEFRWVHPGPDPDAGRETATDADYRVTDRPDAAWSYWMRSGARDALRGLSLSLDESWAVQELTRDRLRRASEETRLLAVRDEGGTRGLAYRARSHEPEADGDRWAEYGLAAWDDLPSARALFDAIARDAAAVGADRTRVLVPETPRHVSDAAYAGVELGSEPDFVLEADLSGR